MYTDSNYEAFAKSHGSEDQSQRFFTYSPDLLVIIDFEGKIRLTNPAWQARLGYSQEELIAKPIIELIHPEDQMPILLDFEKIIANEVLPSPPEHRVLCKDGSFKWVSWTVVLFL